jgi:3-oxoacyl-[acyl-carrier-protein] synthase-3
MMNSPNLAPSLRYDNVYLDAFGYALPANVITSEDLEKRLAPLYQRLHLQAGQLEALTGVNERRFWDNDYRMSEGAIRAGQNLLNHCSVTPQNIGMLIYGGVCRDQLEPATACAVAHGLGLAADALVYDVSNACLGVINGMLQIADAIELGRIKAGIVVSCESARQIVETTVQRMLKARDMEMVRKTIATLTGGSGAVAVLLTDGSFGLNGHKLLGGCARNAVCHHGLCTWGPDSGIPAQTELIMDTDSVGVLQNGVKLGIDTFDALRKTLAWSTDKPDKIICHQVGAAHQKAILNAIGISSQKDFTTFRYLGNMGTVSLPLTAAMADERGFLESGDLVGFLGIGSGLNCLMLGLQW